MKTYRYKNYRYWYDRSTRCWWAAKYDEEGNQIGDAVHAYNKSTIQYDVARGW